MDPPPDSIAISSALVWWSIGAIGTIAGLLAILRRYILARDANERLHKDILKKEREIFLLITKIDGHLYSMRKDMEAMNQFQKTMTLAIGRVEGTMSSHHTAVSNKLSSISATVQNHNAK